MILYILKDTFSFDVAQLRTLVQTSVALASYTILFETVDPNSYNSHNLHFFFVIFKLHVICKGTAQHRVYFLVNDS